MFYFFCIVLFILPEMRALPFGNEQFEGNKCRTHNGSSGICTFIYECQWVLTNLKNRAMTHSDIVKCGFDGDRYIICCNNLETAITSTTITTTTSTTTTTTSLPVLNLSNPSRNIGFEGNGCRTKTGTNGICTLINECQWLLTNLRNKTMTHSDIVECGFDGARFIICCEVPATVTAKTTIPTTTIRLPSLHQASSNSIEKSVSEGNGCRTKTGTNGICTLINECQWLLTNLRNKTMTHSDIVECGFDGARFIICCEVPATVTAKTTIPTTTIRLPSLHPASSNFIEKSVSACQQYPQIESRDRIVGGVSAMLGEYPHMAVLGRLSQEVANTYDWFCGGSLISERYVLTAAHCGKPTVVRLHDIDLANESSDDITIDVEMMTRHPNYKKSLVYNDIALVKLANSINFTEIIFPACLWTESDESLLLRRSTISACGFGVKQFASTENSKQLLKIGLKVVNIDACNASYIASETLRKLPNYIAPSQLCAFDETLKNDTCQGDSGGPLQILHENKYKLIGVISFGFSCASAIPSVYTRVSHYTEWIESIVWP